MLVIFSLKASFEPSAIFSSDEPQLILGVIARTQFGYDFDFEPTVGSSALPGCRQGRQGS
jgi:hypothetical protein